MAPTKIQRLRRPVPKEQSLLGYTGDGFAGPARQLTPEPGHTFQILEDWLDISTDPNGVLADLPGGTMTFGTNRFELVSADGVPGKYVVVVIVTDLNGNSTTTYATVTVTR